MDLFDWLFGWDWTMQTLWLRLLPLVVAAAAVAAVIDRLRHRR